MHDIFIEYRMAFFEETEEHLLLLNENSIRLERDPGDLGCVDAIFRILHTLKSSAAAVGFSGLSLFSHQAEDLVQNIRNREIEINGDVIDALFIIFDRIQEFVRKARLNRDGDVDFEGAARKISGLAPRRKKGAADAPEGAGRLGARQVSAFSPDELEKIKEARIQHKKIYWARFEIDPSEPIKWLRAELLLNHLLKIADVLRCVPEKEAMLNPSFSGAFSVLIASREKQEVIRKAVAIDLLRSAEIKPVRGAGRKARLPGETFPEAGPTAPDAPSPGREEDGKVRSMASGSIRVPVKRLDDLMHLVGEMVVSNSGLKLLEGRLKTAHGDGPLIRELNMLVDKLIKITASLQTGVLKARMLPVDVIFGQYARIVRDLSRKEGKEIDLVVRGRETEIDKKVIDAIGEPLTHLVRNAVDHGIEPPEVREKTGKPGRATIQLTAAQTGNHILISVKDDGRGIDIEKVRAQAVKNGLAAESRAGNLTESEILNFIFELGFSTSDEVNSVSGRGIGLNVVRNVISGLNGSVSVYSKPDEGTEFVITLPLTLAITTVILVKSGGIQYGIPIFDIRESIKIPEREIIERPCARAVNWAGRVIPILGLNDILVNRRGSMPVYQDGLVPVLIVAYRDRELGLAVDRILGKQEIVLKPLEENFKTIRGISGAAILGDGSVILVADTREVIHILKEIENAGKTPENQKAYGEARDS
jgi:two-component system, chemotaxis family, sensor kinase CheA